jgi:hypothetical protein
MRIGHVVHYVSYGTPGGEYDQTCRAAIVTADGRYADTLHLFVMNPTGVFLNQDSRYDETAESGGSWHKLEDCDR